MTASTLVIITGASRGLGHAMAAQYLAGGAFVVGLSRALSATLARAAAGAWSSGRSTWPIRCRWPSGWARGWPMSSAAPPAPCRRACA